MRGGALDLLNMPLDEEGLISLLCDDDLQVSHVRGRLRCAGRGVDHAVWQGLMVP